MSQQDIPRVYKDWLLMTLFVLLRHLTTLVILSEAKDLMLQYIVIPTGVR